MVRVALLTLSLALPRPVAASVAPPPIAPATPEVQRPTGAAEPAVQRPGELSPGTGAPTSSRAPASAPAPAVTTAPAPAVTTAPAPAVAPRRMMQLRPQVGVVEAPAGGVAKGDGVPRYFQAPFNESMWPSVVGQEMLMVFGSGARECVTVTKKTPDALFYVHRKNGKQQAPLVSVTSLHQNSWECKRHDATPSEWARSGAAVGLGLSGLGMLMGVLYDVAHVDPKCELSQVTGAVCPKGGPEMPHFVYSVIGVTTTTLGTPVVAIGGASTSRDLRVKGKIWARATGWTLYSAATLMNILWLTGFYGKVEALQVRGLTAGAGVLGLGGSAFMAVDALLSRQELIQLRKEDATRRPTAGRGLRFGASPIGQGGHMTGMSLGVGGRF